MIKTIQSPHDKFFKAAMSDLRVAKDFFDFHLPSSIKKTIELDTLAQMIRENLSPEIEEIIMTPAQYFREEGFEKGIEKGRINEKKDLAKKLLHHGLALVDVSKLTDLSVAELENLTNNYSAE